MSTLARRSPRVLLVAAVSTTAWVGSTAAAGAAEPCDPATADCTDLATNFATVLSTVKSTEKTTELTTEKTTERTTERTMETVSDRAVLIRKPVVLSEPEVSMTPEISVTKDVEETPSENPPLAIAEFCHASTSDKPLAALAVRAMTRFLGLQMIEQDGRPAVLTRNGDVFFCDGGILETTTYDSVQRVEVPPTVESTTEKTTETTTQSNTNSAIDSTIESGEPGTVTTRTVRTVNTAVAPSAESEVAAAPATGGVDVDSVEVEDGTAVAPEQHEVAAPATVVTDALPRTGGDGPALTMLGLALIASGTAVHRAARD